MAANIVAILLRASNRSTALRAQITRTGGRAIAMPIFSLATEYDCPAAIAFLRQPKNYGLLLFSSPYGVQALRGIALRHQLTLPTAMACAAPGIASRKELIKAGFTNITTPPGIGDLRTLCAELGNQRLVGKRIALVQRVNALPHANTLLVRNKAIPVPMPCYRRTRIAPDTWSAKFDAVRASVNTIIAFEAASLEALNEIAGTDLELIHRLNVGVIHPAIKDKALEIGYENIICHGDITTLLKQLQSCIPSL